MRIVEKDIETEPREMIFREGSQVETDIIIKSKMDMLNEEIAAFSNKLDSVTKRYNGELQTIAELFSNTPGT